jgi:hypothetical protein
MQSNLAPPCGIGHSAEHFCFVSGGTTPITGPLNILTASSRAIAKGDFSKRVELKSRTEFGELANYVQHHVLRNSSSSSRTSSGPPKKTARCS